MKRVYKDNKASAHWSAARNEERPWSWSSTCRQPVIVFLASNRPSCSLIGFNMFVHPNLSRSGLRGISSRVVFRNLEIENERSNPGLIVPTDRPCPDTPGPAGTGLAGSRPSPTSPRPRICSGVGFDSVVNCLKCSGFGPIGFDDA